MTSRYGKGKERRMLRCSVCKARFSERNGTPLFDSRLPPKKVEWVLEHIAEGCGVRQTGRLCKVNRGAVGRLSELAGEHARDLHDEWVALSPRTREVQFDERWSFVAQKEKDCDPLDPADGREGDAWDHVAIDAESRLVVSVVPGERTAESVVAVVEDFNRRTGDRLMDLITTDGHPATRRPSSEPTGRRLRRRGPARQDAPKAP